jgi:HEAT repeat protein
MGIFDSMLKINIGEMKAKRDLEGLFGALNNKRNAFARRDAAKALGEIGDAIAMEPLIAALKDPKRDVRDAAVEAIGKIGGDPRAVAAFVEPLRNGNSIAREEAASAFGKIRHKSGVELLVPALKDEDCFVRQSAAASLGKISDPAAVEGLAQTLKDEDKEVRQAAAIALGEIGGTAAVEPLVQSLKDESVMVRYRTVESLGKIGGPGAVDALIEALKDGGWISPPAGKGKPPNKKVWVRQKAIEVLADMGDSKAVAPITEALNDKQEVIRQAAQKALQKLTANTAGR